MHYAYAVVRRDLREGLPFMTGVEILTKLCSSCGLEQRVTLRKARWNSIRKIKEANERS